MSLLLELMAERAISKAIKEGELDNLNNSGQPIELTDDSMVPEQLRTGYRILKNAGYIPPELEQRNQALELCDLLAQSEQESPEYKKTMQKIRQLELKMRVKGIDTKFIYRYLSNKSPS